MLHVLRRTLRNLAVSAVSGAVMPAILIVPYNHIAPFWGMPNPITYSELAYTLFLSSTLVTMLATNWQDPSRHPIEDGARKVAQRIWDWIIELGKRVSPWNKQSKTEL